MQFIFAASAETPVFFAGASPPPKTAVSALLTSLIIHAANRAAERLNKPTPHIIKTIATIFPPIVTGYTSPYPTVLTVSAAHHKASKYVFIFADSAPRSKCNTISEEKMVPAKSIVTASNSVEPALLGKKNLSPFPDVRTERIILAAEIILPYLSTVMKAIADIKSTIPHFQNPILSAADKYLHATSIRKKYARREIGQSEYFYRFRVLHKYVRIRKLNRCNARPEQYECVPPAPLAETCVFSKVYS